jgi:hypothetical protein
MGMELFVEVDGVEYPLLGYRNGHHLYEKDGEYRTVPSPAKVNFKKSIRHSEHFVQMSDFQSTPYSTEVMELQYQYSSVVSQQGVREQQLDFALKNQVGGNANIQTLAPIGSPDAGVADDVAILQNNAATGLSGLRDNASLMNESLRGIEEDLAEKTHETHFDALIVSLRLEPDRDLQECYLFARASYFHPDEEDPDALLYNIQLTGVGDLLAGEPKPVRFVMTDFPQGPKITEMTYHLYSGDREISTDFSEQRITLSEAEAYDFLYADLFTEVDPPDTDPELFKLLPASLVPVGLSPGVVTEARVSLPVLATGDVDNIEVSRCPEESRAPLEALVRQARFLPAVEEGNPVDRQVTFALADIIAL